MGEQRGQVRVVQFIVDDKADIDRDRRAVVVDRNGMTVAAGTKLAVVNRDRIALRQCPCRGIAGNTRTDYRDPHASPPVFNNLITRERTRSFNSAPTSTIRALHRPKL